MNLDNQNIKVNALFASIEVPVLDEIENIVKSERIYATGRRKHASARLWLSNGTGFEINKKSLKEYFLEDALVSEILSPLACVEKHYGPVIVKFFATVKGSGIVSQAFAVRLALARTLIEYDIRFREVLKKAGYLTRDSRKKEREHYGFRTSRKPQQYKRR